MALFIQNYHKFTQKAKIDCKIFILNNDLFHCMYFHVAPQAQVKNLKWVSCIECSFGQTSLSHFSSQQWCQSIQTTMPERLHMVPYREFTMQIKKTVPLRANPLPYGCFRHAVWGNTHFLSFIDIETAGSEVTFRIWTQNARTAQQLPNHQETQRNKVFWQKNKPNEVLQLENGCNQILRLWTPYLMSPSSDPKNLSVLPRKTVYLIPP